METTAYEHQASILRQNFVDHLKSQGYISTPQVEEAFRIVPRHRFFTDMELSTIYSDASITTNFQGQRLISNQPSIVAAMLEMLDIQPGQSVLVIGIGSGYLTALVAHLVGTAGQVITLDLDADAIQHALTPWQTANGLNIQVICQEGASGWLKAAPYDRIIVTGWTPDIPPSWINQLRPGGCLLLPLLLVPLQSELAMPSDQFLIAFKRHNAGPSLESQAIRSCNFPPLYGSDDLKAVHSVPLDPLSNFTSLSLYSINSHSAFPLLSEPAIYSQTDFTITPPEVDALRLWLVLREPQYCELVVNNEAASKSSILPFFKKRASIASIGLYQRETWSLLALEENSSSGSNPQHMFRLTIQTFGRGLSLAEHLHASISAWDQAGRPFLWTPHGSMEKLRIHTYPVGTEYFPQRYELSLTRPQTEFIFTPQRDHPALDTHRSTSDGRESAPLAHDNERTTSGSQRMDRGDTYSNVDRMSRLDTIDLLKKGKERWNQWRKESPEVIPDLVQADLEGAILKELDLRRARLNGANLARADLFGSDLSGASLNGANLRQIRGAQINLSGADLRGTDLSNSFLVKANLNGASLNGATLREARFKATTLDRSDLSGVDLVGAHLTRTTLYQAILAGANLAALAIQDTTLPENYMQGELFATYRTYARNLTQVLSQPHLEFPVSQTFGVKYEPRLNLKHLRGNISIRSWERSEICIRSTGQLPQCHQEQDTIFVSEGEDDLDVLVPYLPHGILRLSQHGSTTITTSVSGEHLFGNITIQETGPVTLSHIDGNVVLQAIVGDTTLSHLSQEAYLTDIAGNLRIHDLTWIAIDRVGGNLDANSIQHALYCGSINGNCILHHSSQAAVSLGRCGGNLHLLDLTSSLDTNIGGNLHLQSSFPPSSIMRVTVGGTANIMLPDHADLQISITAGGSISGDMPGKAPTGSFATLTYGEGHAKLDLITGGGVLFSRTAKGQ